MPAASSRDLLYRIRAEDVQFRQRMARVDASFAKTERAGEKAFRDVQRAAERSARKMRSEFDQANGHVAARFGQLRGVMQTTLAGFGVGLGAFGAVSALQGIRSAASEMAALGDTAEKVGVTVEQLQALRIEFEKSGVSSTALDTAMQRFSRRVGEAAQGTGVLVGDLSALGISLTNADGSMRPLVDIFADYAQGIKEAENQQEALRLAFKAFDRQGAGMVNLLRQIGSGAREMANRFNGSPDAISSEDVRRAREIDAAFAEMARELDVVAKKLSLQFGPTLVSAASAVSDIVQAFGNLGGTASDIREELEKGVVLARKLDSQAQSAIGGMRGVADAAADVNDANEETVKTLEEQQAHVDQLSRRLERVNEAIALAEAEGAAERVLRLSEGAERLQGHIEAARRALLDMQGVSVPLPTTAPPGIGPIGAQPPPPPPTARQFVSSRAANQISTERLTDAAAVGAASVLARFSDLRVSSAYRSPEHNRSINGAKHSRHMSGDAVDFVGVTPENVGAIVSALRSQGFRGFGYYNNGSLHADMGSPRAWGPDKSSSSLGRTPWQFQEAVGPVLREQGQINDQVEADRLALLKEQNAERERQQAAIAAVNESLAAQLEMAGLENELLETGKFSLEEINAALSEEQLVREKLNQLRSAGVEVTAEMEAAIRAEVAAVFELKAANESLSESQRKVADGATDMGQAFQAVGQPIVDTFVNIASGAGNAEDAIKSLIKQIANMLIQGALFGSGPLGKIFGGGLLAGFSSGGPVALAAGGYVSGPGGPRSDAVPALLSDGEFVVNAKATRRHGRLLAAINGGQQLAHFAAGGMATPSRLLPGGLGGSMTLSTGVLKIELASRFDADGGFTTAVEKASRPVAVQEVRSGLTEYDRGEMQGPALLGRIDRAREKY